MMHSIYRESMQANMRNLDQHIRAMADQSNQVALALNKSGLTANPSTKSIKRGNDSVLNRKVKKKKQNDRSFSIADSISN